MSPICNEDFSREKWRSQGGSSNRQALTVRWSRGVSVILHNYGLRELRQAGVAFGDRYKRRYWKEGLCGKMAVFCLIILHLRKVKWSLEKRVSVQEVETDIWIYRNKREMQETVKKEKREREKKTMRRLWWEKRFIKRKGGKERHPPALKKKRIILILYVAGAKSDRWK